MSRQESLSRLNDLEMKNKDPLYIHYYFLIMDVKETLEKYVHGNFIYGPVVKENLHRKSFNAEVLTRKVGLDKFISFSYK